MMEFILAYRQAKAQIKARRVKDAQYKQLCKTPLNYQIIRDLVNAAAHDVKIDVILPDGSRLTIQREDAFDKLQKAPKTDLY
ncbi:MAG: hypothetical protein WC455_16085 [Dehalococcoidia bacterium]|jgi:hypothetical protein